MLASKKTSYYNEFSGPFIPDYFLEMLVIIVNCMVLLALQDAIRIVE